MDRWAHPRPLKGGIIPWAGNRLKKLGKKLRAVLTRTTPKAIAPSLPPPESKTLPVLIEARHKDKNAAGQIFGGWLMSQMDKAATDHALDTTFDRWRTKRVESMEFVSPVQVGQAVSVQTEIVHRDAEMVKVEVAAYRAPREEPNQLTKVTSALFTLKPLRKD
jgi:acyl-CoA thioesterase YciA